MIFIRLLSAVLKESIICRNPTLSNRKRRFFLFKKKGKLFEPINQILFYYFFRN